MKLKVNDEVINKYNGLYLGVVTEIYTLNRVKWAKVFMYEDLIRDFKLKILKKI